MENYLTEYSEENTLPKQASKQASISYLRIFATVCVIWLHTCSTLCENQDLFNLDYMQSIFFSASYQMMYWAVPIFFMITGMLFLRPEMHVEARDYFFKYSKRILLALFIFGIPYAALKMVSSEGLNISLLGKSILAVISDTGFGHLWYLYVLIGIYLIMPVLRNFCDKASNDEMKLVLIALFIFCFCFPLISRLTGFKVAFSSQILYPVFYVLMGHWLYENRMRFNRKLAGVVMLVCVCVIWMLNILNFKSNVMTQYDSPIIAILAGSIFALFVSKEWKDRPELWNIDRLCFGAYLIHPLFIQFTYRFIKITPIDFPIYPIATVLFSVVFIFLAFGTSWLMRKIGILRRYVL